MSDKFRRWTSASGLGLVWIYDQELERRYQRLLHRADLAYEITFHPESGHDGHPLWVVKWWRP